MDLASDEREPLVDLASSAPTSPAAETLPQYTEAASEIPATTETTGSDGPPERQPDDAGTTPLSTLSSERRLTLTPWYFTRVCAVYIGPVKYVPGKINNRWLIVSEAIFYIMTTIQVPLTATLTTLGVINKDKELGTRSELAACPELAVVNVLWLLRPAYIGYFLLWAHLLRRKVMQLREARQAGSLAAAEWRLSDEDMKKLLPSPPSILVHLRLTALAPAVTWILTVITISTWWACVDRCRATSPHIFLLASIILFAVNLSCAVYFGFMFNSALEDLMRGIRSRLPSVAPLSQSAVDRVPLVVYRAAECGADSSQHVLVPTQWGPAAVASPDQMPPKHGRTSDSLQISHKPDASIRLPDVEDGTEATPLLDLQGSSDVVNDMEATPLLNLVEGLPGVIQYPTYPYVILPDDEAKCTICLCDFTDPSGLDGVVVHDTQPDVEMERPSDDLGRQAEGVTYTPPLLLRRLSCGHVYHKECIDPWLTQKSGRCPYCQQAVEVPGEPKWGFLRFLECECRCRRSR